MCFTHSSQVFAQEQETTVSDSADVQNIQYKDVIDFKSAGKQPAFKKKKANTFNKWVTSRLIYPEKAQRQRE